MPSTQRLDVEKGKDFIGFEKFEGGNVACGGLVNHGVIWEGERFAN